MFNLFKKEHCKIDETYLDKSYKRLGYSDSIIFYKFYQECSPVFNAINLVVDSCVDVELSVKDKQQEELVNHPILNILKKPNPFTDGKTFLQEFLKDYLIAGNAYINVNKANNTTELTIINDSDISITNRPIDNFPDRYQYSNSNIYTRQKDNKFFDQKGNQIIHLRNAKIKQKDTKGASFLLGCQLEMNQYLEASVHNNALLKNQCKPAKIISMKGTVNAQWINAIKEMFRKNSGSANAGNNLFIPHEVVDVKDAGYNPQDLDFKNLKRDCDIAIQKCLKIPLPLVVADNMTLSNLESSVPIFYDNAILPLMNRYVAFLNSNLLPLFDNENRYEIIIDVSQIRALKQRTINDVMKSFEGGLITRNEGRAEIGREDTNGGDTFYQPQNLIPVGSDRYTTDNRQTTNKNAFIKRMQELKDADGNRIYNDDFIETNAEIYFDQ